MEERYKILEELGSGGFGSVSKARDEMLLRDVAVKRLDNDLFSDEVRKQLLQEARLLASMQHPNIVSIYDISSKEDHDEIVMELLDGISLDRIVKRHLLQASDVRNIAGQILKALSAAHEADILHCDLKPENVMLCLAPGNHYEAKVYDFGLSVTSEVHDPDKKSELLGSIYVMAPELFNGEKPTVQSDIYSLGCILYYLLVGQYPFVGDTSIQVMASHITGNHVPLSVCRKDLSSELCLWIESLIQSDSKARYKSCEIALNDLRKVYIPKGETTFTLPTSLEIEGDNSRLVRNISVESLNAEDEFHSGENTTVFLDNTFRHSSLIGFKPSLPDVILKKASPLIPESEELCLPEDAEWYFTMGDKTKGPVNLQQLKKLCLEGKIWEETLVWHSLFGDWVMAANCAEAQESFEEKKAIADAKIAELEAAQLRKRQELEAKKELEKKEQLSWVGPELYTLISASAAITVFYFTHPEIRHYIIPFYYLILLCLGLFASRLYQRQEKASWGYSWPVIGDVLYALKVKKTRLVLCAALVLVGSVGLTVAGMNTVALLKQDNNAKEVDAKLGIKSYNQLKKKELEGEKHAEMAIAAAKKKAMAKAEIEREVREKILAEQESQQAKKISLSRGNKVKSFSEALRERQKNTSNTK